MTQTIQFGTFPVFRQADGSCRLRAPFPASNRVNQWSQAMQRAVAAGGDQARPAAAALLKPGLLNALGAGYIIPAPFDVKVDLRRTGGEVSLQQQLPKDIDGEFLEHFRPFPDGHGVRQISGSPWENTPWILKLRGFWYIETPPGYSCLFASPQLFSGETLPLYALPGIIETDRYKNLISFPMIPQLDFPIIIKEGTPLVQVIPFKRTDWQAEVEPYDDL
jgi:hypothetical protein